MSRVLLVGKGPPDRGGIAALLRVLIASDLRQRHEVTLLNLTRKGPPTNRKLSIMNLRRAVEDGRALWRAARGNDIVHIHTALGRPAVTLRAGLFALIARLRRSAVAVHAHSGMVGDWLDTPTRRLITRIALLPAHRVVTVAATGCRALSELLGSDRVLFIANGVDVKSYAPPGAPNDPPRVLYAGYLTPRKGVVDLLNASAILRTRGIPHELLLVGGTPTEGAGTEAAVREAATQDAQFIGPVPHEQMPDYYCAVDVFCLPSWWEAMPMSVLEAMAAGLPVVASDVGEIPRLVDQGVTGLLVPPKQPEALADALQGLLEDVTTRRKMGASGRATVADRYGLDQTVAALDKMYGELAAMIK